MEMELSFKNMPLPARVNYLASKALMTWTFDEQLRQVVEELNELALAVCKLSRKKKGETGINEDKHIVVDDKYRNAVMDEIADVEIMIAQLKRMIAVTGSTVGDYEYKATLARKLEKLAIEIEEEE